MDVDRNERDLDLAVELVNTHWVLADPPDRLTDTATFQGILRDAGEDVLAGELAAEDLPRLRALRTQLAPLFDAPPAEAVERLDRLLRAAPVQAGLALGDEGRAGWTWAAGEHGMPALRARLLAALAEHLVRNGTARIGVCDAEPCRCVYVDRSRARTRRYCCDQCNDRAAAAAYRARRKA
jgi:predicted RNA-binding Zn ribbon-like protein